MSGDRGRLAPGAWRPRRMRRECKEVRHKTLRTVAGTVARASMLRQAAGIFSFVGSVKSCV